MPSGGTSDYAPEMIHAAAQGEPYACFVRPDTQIPFMAMPDGVEALIRLADAPRERLTRTAYNVGGLQPVGRRDSDGDRRGRFPEREAHLRDRRQAPGHRRLLAGRPWTIRRRGTTGGSRRHYDFDRAFSDYLIPTIRRRYQ